MLQRLATYRSVDTATSLWLLTTSFLSSICLCWSILIDYPSKPAAHNCKDYIPFQALPNPKKNYLTRLAESRTFQLQKLYSSRPACSNPQLQRNIQHVQTTAINDLGSLYTEHREDSHSIPQPKPFPLTPTPNSNPEP